VDQPREVFVGNGGVGSAEGAASGPKTFDAKNRLLSAAETLLPGPAVGVAGDEKDGDGVRDCASAVLKYPKAAAGKAVKTNKIEATIRGESFTEGILQGRGSIERKDTPRFNAPVRYCVT
jgi:hypothetical protein